MSEITGPNEALPPGIQLNEPPRIPPPAWEASPAPAPSPRPIPFEDLENFPGFWSRVGGMFRMVFSNPMELFERVPVTEGLGAPWRFLLLLCVPAFLIAYLVFSLVGLGITLAALEQAGKGEGEGRAIAAAMPLIFGALLLLMPLFTFLGMVIGGAANHFFLWMWGGLRPGMGTAQSIRAYGYAHAFLQLGGFIPIVGPLIQIAGLVVIGMGLARLHKTDTWRGICAVLTPFVLLCCCLLPILAMAVPALTALGRR